MSQLFSGKDNKLVNTDDTALMKYVKKFMQ